jgi:hypothetical protein
VGASGGQELVMTDAITIRRGRRQGRARMDDPEVRCLLAEHWRAPTISHDDLARYLGVTRRTVQGWGRAMGLVAKVETADLTMEKVL